MLLVLLRTTYDFRFAAWKRPPDGLLSRPLIRFCFRLLVWIVSVFLPYPWALLND